MDRKIIGSCLVSVFWGIYLITQRQYTAAAGAFTAAVVMFPILIWIDGLELPQWVWNAVVVGIVILTVIESVWLLRKKHRSKRQ